MATIEYANASGTGVVATPEMAKEKSFRFEVYIAQEAEGDFSIVALNLPGAASCGDTEDEATSNFQEAAAAIVASYEDAGENIPWKGIDENDIPRGAKRRRIIVHV